MARKKATIKAEPPKKGRYATFKESNQGSYPAASKAASKIKKSGSNG